jgi:hypothetical protein
MNMFRILIAVTVLFCSSFELFATDTSTRLQLTARRMQDWLGTGDRAIGWRRYLHLNVLDTQAAKGPYADQQALNQILQRFDSGAAGLEHPNFVACREAIRQHLAHLQRVRFENIQQQIQNAKTGYVPVADDLTVYAQQLAATDTQLMLDYYRRNITGLDYKDLEEMLQLSQIEAFVSKLQTNQPLDAEAGLNEIRPIIVAMNDAALRVYDPYFPVAHESMTQLLWVYFNKRREATLESLFISRLEQIEAAMTKLDQEGYDRETASELGQFIGFLTYAHQAPELVTALKAKYSMPNFMVSISEKTLTELVARPVNQTTPVDEQILDQRIFGMAHTSGQLNIDAVRDPHQAHLSIQLIGNVNSSNYSHSGPITVYSGSAADIEARRSILMNVNGLLEYRPYAAANLESYFRGASTGPFIERIVGRVFENQKPKYQPIGARRAEQRVFNEFAEETNTSIVAGRKQLAEARQENERVLAMRPSAYMTTTDTQLWVVGHRASSDQIAAPVKAMRSSVATDIQVHLHESMINNFLEPALKNKTIDSKNYSQQLSEIFGPLPIDVQDDPNAEEFAIVLAPVRPVQVQFQDDVITIQIYGQRFRRERETLSDPMFIHARFKFFRTAEGIEFRKDGRITVEYALDRAPNARVIAFKTFFEDRLNLIADQPENKRPLKLRNNLFPSDQIPQLQNAENLQNVELVNLNINNGWLNVGWNYRPGMRPTQPGNALDIPSLFDN